MKDYKYQTLREQILKVLPELKAALSKENAYINLHGVLIPREQGQEMLDEFGKIVDNPTVSDFNGEILPLSLLIVNDDWRSIQVTINNTY